MAGLVLIAFAVEVAVWVFLIRVAGRALLRRRRRPASGGAVRPSRSEPKRRDDFTLTS